MGSIIYVTINKKDYKKMGSHFGLYNVSWSINFSWGSEDHGIPIDSEESDYMEVAISVSRMIEQKLEQGLWQLKYDDMGDI